MAMHGHGYLLNELIQQIQNLDTRRSRVNHNTHLQYQLLNAVDKDFSTPLILALQARKHNMVKQLLDNDHLSL